MIFGGLEIVAGGYLVHRHYKHKNAKKRQADELEARRHNTFPGARPTSHCQHAQQAPPQYQQPAVTQQPVIAQQKYACYAPSVASLPQAPQQHLYPVQPFVQAQAQTQPRPGPPRHAQTFTIPRRPVPESKPQIIIEPSLQRTDSFATLSRMPIANGYRPQGLPQDSTPVLPPRRHATGGLQPVTTQGVYGNPGFSISTPALGATPTSPGLTYTFATSPQAYGGHSTDDNWETYGHHGHVGDARLSHAPTTASTQLGERDPPPPYMP
jgi:hypothetical protein